MALLAASISHSSYLFQISWCTKKVFVCLVALNNICYASDFVDLEFGQSSEIARLFNDDWIVGWFV